jgi:hypothetical protein
MKEMMKKVESFMTFDFPVQRTLIYRQFTRTHSYYEKQFQNWSLAASRKKVIADFWYKQVLFHYGIMIILSVIVVIPFGININLLLPSILIAGIISLLTFIVFIYWHAYYSDFLPKLDTIITEQEKEMNNTIDIKKCKRTQFSIPTLTIIFYVFSKIGNIPLLASNDRSAELLNNLFGADKDKLKQNLSRLYKPSGLSPKERAEIQKGIDTARIFFQEIGSTSTEPVLNQLQLKLKIT